MHPQSRRRWAQKSSRMSWTLMCIPQAQDCWRRLPRPRAMHAMAMLCSVQCLPMTLGLTRMSTVPTFSAGWSARTSPWARQCACLCGIPRGSLLEYSRSVGRPIKIRLGDRRWSWCVRPRASSACGMPASFLSIPLSLTRWTRRHGRSTARSTRANTC